MGTASTSTWCNRYFDPDTAAGKASLLERMIKERIRSDAEDNRPTAADWNICNEIAVTAEPEFPYQDKR